MRVSAEIQYPANPEIVFQMLSDRTFQERKLAGTGALSWRVTIEPAAGGTRITSTRTLPTDLVPEAFRAMVGAQIDVDQVETWGPAGPDGSRTGTLEVSMGSAPIRLQGSLSLAPGAAGGGTLQRIDGELKARLPLIGGRVERAVEPAILAAITAEQRIGQAWLAEP